MILLPRHEPRILMPVPKSEWREPSRAMPKDSAGRPDMTRFKIEFWRRDGGLIEQRYYDDRDEFDYALWDYAISEPYADVVPLLAVVTTLTASPGSLLIWTLPADYNSASNFIECIGGGGGGAATINSTSGSRSGGGGGGYGRYNNLALAASPSYQIGTGGASFLAVSGSNQGNPGTATWFNGTSYAAAPVGGDYGRGGGAVTGNPTTAAGGAGGVGKGTSALTGGRGGNANSSGPSVTGGGGAAGRNGDGASGTDSSAISPGNGGAGDAGTGGAGSAGVGAGTAAAGGNGTEMDGIGAGGGAGGSSSANGANGGLYGGGAGACSQNNTTQRTTGAGGQGAIWITYTPLLLPSMMLMF